MITALDHVALVVRDLDAAAEHCAALLGRAHNWRGRDGGAEHVWFQLRNTALDVIAPVGAGYTGDRVKAYLDAHGEGIWAMAFAVPDIAHAEKALARRGAPASAAKRIRSTSIETKEPRYWLTAVVAPEAAHGPNIFLIDQPRDAPPWPLSDATGAEAKVQSCVDGIDHIVVRTPNPDRAAAFYGARLGLDMRLDRSKPDWGARLMFFRCGDMIIEIAHDVKGGVGDAPDALWGLSWRVANADDAQARLADLGFNVSEVRVGRKPGTRVFTVRDKTCNVPTLIVEPAQREIKNAP